jgi:hypothetical protein
VKLAPALYAAQVIEGSEIQKGQSSSDATSMPSGVSLRY